VDVKKSSLLSSAGLTFFAIAHGQEIIFVKHHSDTKLAMGIYTDCHGFMIFIIGIPHHNIM